MPTLRLWHSSRTFADWIASNTAINRHRSVEYINLIPSDAAAKDFYLMPARIREILYLDCPDLIIELDGVPICAIEISEEAGTGHNAFQRFARIAAAVERGVPALYIYPQAAWVSRQGGGSRWDQLNPLIFQTLDDLITLYGVPALLYYFPTSYPGTPTNQTKGHLFDPDPSFPGMPDPTAPSMVALFTAIDELYWAALKGGLPAIQQSHQAPWARKARRWMQKEAYPRLGSQQWSPLTATQEVDTDTLLRHLRKYAGKNHQFGSLISDRPRTVIYSADALFRGDPYTGALAAIDYLECRSGPTYEDRDKNLVMAWGRVSQDGGKLHVSGKESVHKFVDGVKSLYSTNKVLLGQSYSQLLAAKHIPRYMFQVRYGTTYTKKKELRIFSHFCDAILFGDGALWREG